MRPFYGPRKKITKNSRLNRLNWTTIATFLFQENRISFALWIIPSFVGDVPLPSFTLFVLPSRRLATRPGRVAFYDRDPLIQRSWGSARRRDLRWCFGVALCADVPMNSCSLSVLLLYQTVPLHRHLPSISTRLPSLPSRFTRVLRHLVVWIDGLLTLVWQMLSPTVNVASLGMMIHSPVGIRPVRALPKGLTLFAA